ncbi:MAG TPA: hypothetical protein VK430_11270 [Xanthobacteraceae bacterium]|nr:hypothetical protein [Xanthobacteraceae bacterium]
MTVRQKRPRRPAKIIVAASLISAWAANAPAAPRQLDCLLTDTPTRPGSESRSVVVVYDEDNKTLTAEASGRRYSFSKVTITYIAISGHADDISLGIDRSSLGIVWQQYEADRVNTEYGHCRPAPG